jgi:outer membrane protein, heavy metal efflux system
MFSFSLQRVAALAAAALLLALPLVASAAPFTLDAALDLAVQRSEAARSARAGRASASEAARASAQPPDPMLRAGVDNLPATGADRLNSSRDSMTMKRLGISQEWLSADKRAARQVAADAEVSRESISIRVAEAETRLQTALAYIDAYFAGESLKLARLTEHHAHEEGVAARARLSSSTGSSQEVLAMDAARGIAEDDTAEVRQQQAAASVALRRWTGQSPDELPAMAPLPIPSEAAFVENHPSFVSIERSIEVAKQAAAVASSERRPNWTWEVSYGQRTGYADMLSFGVSIPIPIAREQRQDRETASKLALVDKAEAELAEASRMATAEYQSLASDAQRLGERIERYRQGVVAPAAQRTAAALAGYRSNQTALTALFEARHAEVDAQRKLLGLQRELARAQAQLAFKPLASGAQP